MEQSCYRCGAKFEEGLAFCPQCNAPQIRVVTEAGEALTESPEFPANPLAHYPGVPRSGAFEWPKALTAAALATVIGVLLVLLLGSPGLSELAGGFLAVVFYRRRMPFAQIGAGVGALLGTLSGALAFGILAVSLAVDAAVLHSWQQVQHNVIEMVREASARSPYPVSPEVMEFFQTPAGFVALLFTTLVVFLIFAILGGAIGGAILARRKPPEIGRL